MAPPYDQVFRTETGPPDYTSRAKFPCIYFADCELGSLNGYVNNSLEGLEFDQNPATTGTIIIPNGVVTPNFQFYDSGSAPTSYSIVSANISNALCTIETATRSPETLNVGDVISINGILFDATHPYINGTWVIASIPSNTTFTFEINAEDAAMFSLHPNAQVAKGLVFQIADYRPTTDAVGKSFTSVMFTPREIFRVAPGFKRILPSDLYTRFRFQTGSDINPQGGINSNLFNVLDSAGRNIKPVLWAYFFGFCDSSFNAVTRPTANHFSIAFNSYAVVLRPSGTGSNLEFALVKFNWGTDTDQWMTSIVDQSFFKSYDTDFPGSALGYLISTNPETGSNKVTELAKSDSFTYDAEFPVKLNLKITIRKHLLSDSQLDGTYLVNLMINDNYDLFGPGIHYDTVLHAYIAKPTTLSNTTIGSQPFDSMLMPMLYFKFNNINEQIVNAPSGDLTYAGSSKIVQDSLFFRQLNAAAVNTAGTSYLY